MTSRNRPLFSRGGVEEQAREIQYTFAMHALPGETTYCTARCELSLLLSQTASWRAQLLTSKKSEPQLVSSSALLVFSSAMSASEAAPPWYLTAEMIESSPSRQYFVRKYGSVERARSREQESRLTTCAFLQESGQKLRLCVALAVDRAPACESALALLLPPCASFFFRAYAEPPPPPSLPLLTSAQAAAQHCDRHRLLPPLLCARVIRDLRTISGGRLFRASGLLRVARAR